MLVGISNGVKEMWITHQPFLTFCYMWQYTPTIAWFITNLLGRKRVQNFKAGLVGFHLRKSMCTKLIWCIFTLSIGYTYQLGGPPGVGLQKLDITMFLT